MSTELAVMVRQDDLGAVTRRVRLRSGSTTVTFSDEQCARVVAQLVESVTEPSNFGLHTVRVDLAPSISPTRLHTLWRLADTWALWVIWIAGLLFATAAIPVVQ